MTPAGAVAPEVLYGWYGDDLTGATDTLATIARRGRRAFLFLSVPSADHLEAASSVDAVGIAGAARTMSPDEMRQGLPAVGAFFENLGVRILHYKCCSTFDSAPHMGNLAVAVEVLRSCFKYPLVPIVGGQPSLSRFCSFSNLFASAGDRVFRIDRHPTMSRHPATPMGEADLVRHFAALGLPNVASIHWPAFGALSSAWERVASEQASAVLLDTLDDGHLAAIGAQLRSEAEKSSMLAVGASSVAEAWFTGPAAAAPKIDAGPGPVFAFVGSLSPVTQGQVAAAKTYSIIEIPPDEVVADSARRDAVIAEAVSALAVGHNAMVTTAPRSGPAPTTLLRGLAEASGKLVDEIVRQSGVRRVAIAGGDTSTLVTTALGFWGLAYHGLAGRGVTICRGRSDGPDRDGMLVMLKGGQMGDERVFDRFAGGEAAA